MESCVKTLQNKLMKNPSCTSEDESTNWQAGQKITSIFDIFSQGNF